MSVDDRQQRGERGFILILVVWLAALLALLAVAFSAAVQSNLRLASSAIQSAKAETAADAGIQLAAMALASGGQAGAGRRLTFDGQPTFCGLGAEASLAIRVRDTGGLISLNLSNDRLLQALFLGLGATPEAASRATDVIIDYRDADSDRRPGGAEKPEYDAAGRPSGPKNAPFDTVEELNQVLGLDPAMIAAASPYLTVHSQTAGLDPRATSAGLARILARGAALLPAKPGSRPSDDGTVPAEFVIGSPQRVFLVTSEGHLKSGAVYVRQAVIELQAARDALPAVKMWTRGLAEEGGNSPSPPGPLPPC